MDFNTNALSAVDVAYDAAAYDGDEDSNAEAVEQLSAAEEALDLEVEAVEALESAAAGVDEASSEPDNEAPSEASSHSDGLERDALEGGGDAPEPAHVSGMQADAVEPPPPPVPDEAPRRNPAGPRAGGERDMDSKEIISIGRFGELRYYPQHGHITAFCDLRSSFHAPDCRLQRTVQPKSDRASGRPIGLLVAWLQQCGSYDHATGHKHGCKPTLQDRRNAREYFNTLPGAQEFSQYERPARPGDPEEPNRV